MRGRLTDNVTVIVQYTLGNYSLWSCQYCGADKSLARPGRKQAVPVKSVMGRGMDWFS